MTHMWHCELSWTPAACQSYFPNSCHIMISNVYNDCSHLTVDLLVYCLTYPPDIFQTDTLWLVTLTFFLEYFFAVLFSGIFFPRLCNILKFLFPLFSAQDAGLDALAAVISRQKIMGQEIGNELDEQNGKVYVRLYIFVKKIPDTWHTAVWKRSHILVLQWNDLPHVTCWTVILPHTTDNTDTVWTRQTHRPAPAWEQVTSHSCHGCVAFFILCHTTHKAKWPLYQSG